MRSASLFALISALGGAVGCTSPEDAPPPTIMVSEMGPNPIFGGGGVTRRDAGRDLGGDAGDAGACLRDPLDARVLFVIDRSDTMGEFATEGDGLPFNVIASRAAQELLADLPPTSSAGLMLFPSQTFADPSCGEVDALAQQFPFRAPDLMEGLLSDLWSRESLVLGKPRALAMQRAAEGVPETDLSDLLVVLFTDAAAGCVSGTESDGLRSLERRGARVLQIRIGSRSVAASTGTLATFSRVSEVLATLQPELAAVRRRCEGM